MKELHQWIDERWGWYNRGILSRDEFSLQCMDEISYRGADIPTTLASLPDEYQAVMGDFFRQFIPEDHLPLLYLGHKTKQEEREDEAQYLLTARAMVEYFAQKQG